MNKLTKIGASALAGSLVATSAYAGDLSVSGTWEVTGEYTTGSGASAFDALSNSGNPFGSKGNLAFSGSGETDFGTASFMTFTNDTQSGVTSHHVMLDMGDMGTVGFDQGVGSFGLSTIDDKVPSAYEEVWNGTTQTNGDLMDANGGSSGVFGYKNTFMGMNVNVEYAPSVSNGGDAGDGAASGATTNADGTSLNFAITTTSLMDGLDVGAGYGETQYDLPASNVATIDTQSTAVYATYAVGPVTLGAQRNYTSGSVNASNVHIGANEVDIYGIAFNVNENLSISYEDLENTYLKSSASGSAQADVTTNMDGIQVAYTMGGATLRISDVSVDNSGGTVGNSEDRTEISLLMAF